jgi:hypothetical protein
MYGYQLQQQAANPPANPQSIRLSRKERKLQTTPITQKCSLCGIDETPLNKYTHCDKKSAKYVCTTCKSTTQNTQIINITKLPIMQKPESTRCVSCRVIPPIVNPLVKDEFPGIPGEIIMQYLSLIPNQLVTVDEYTTLDCKRRLCLNCYENLINRGDDGTIVFYGCDCKNPHYLT